MRLPLFLLSSSYALTLSITITYIRHSGTMVVDSAAANRFIKAAISGIKPSSQGEPALIPVPMPSVGKHTRFQHSLRPMEPRREDESDDDDDNEGGGLEVIDNADEQEKEKPVEDSSSGGKRRRMDPFSGTPNISRHSKSKSIAR